MTQNEARQIILMKPIGTRVSFISKYYIIYSIFYIDIGLSIS